MASKIDSDDLKRQALLKMAQGRAELTVQSERLRKELNPKLAARKLIGRHPGAVVLTTFSTGLVLILLVFRRRYGNAKESGPHEPRGRDNPKAPGGGFLGILIRAAVPALVKIAVGKPLDQLFASTRQDGK